MLSSSCEKVTAFSALHPANAFLAIDFTLLKSACVKPQFLNAPSPISSMPEKSKAVSFALSEKVFDGTTEMFLENVTCSSVVVW